MGISERKEREKERRRQQIVVAAKRMFSNYGFSRTTMEDIAKEAELSPGTLYLYFKNKEELYATLSLRVLEYLILRLKHLEDETDPDAVGKIRRLMEVMHDVYEFDPLMIISLFHLQSSETLKNLSAEMMAEIETLSRQSTTSIAEIFRQGIEQGVFTGHHPMALADTFWSLFSGVILWETSKSLIDSKKDYLRTTLQTAFDVFLRGIRTQE